MCADPQRILSLVRLDVCAPERAEQDEASSSGDREEVERDGSCSIRIGRVDYAGVDQRGACSDASAAMAIPRCSVHQVGSGRRDIRRSDPATEVDLCQGRDCSLDIDL